MSPPTSSGRAGGNWLRQCSSPPTACTHSHKITFQRVSHRTTTASLPLNLATAGLTTFFLLLTLRLYFRKVSKLWPIPDTIPESDSA
jgi:hypothetical protein